MILRPSRANCSRIEKSARIFDVYAGEIGQVIEVCPTSVEIKWPANEHPVGLSFVAIMAAGRYCLI